MTHVRRNFSHCFPTRYETPYIPTHVPEILHIIAFLR